MDTQISFVFDDGVRDLSAYQTVVMFDKVISSHNPSDKMSFAETSLETDIAQGMIFEEKQIGIMCNFTIDVDPGNKFKKTRRAVQCYKMRKKTFCKYQFYI